MALLRIREVRALDGFRLRLTLTDDSVIERDVRALLVGRFSNLFETTRRFLRRPASKGEPWSGPMAPIFVPTY